MGIGPAAKKVNDMRIRIGLWMTCVIAALVATGCIMPKEHNLPPAHRLMHPGPGVGGPGPGVMPPMVPPHAEMYGPKKAVQILFARPEGMQVAWDVSAQGAFDSTPLVVPGRQNFPEGAIYRLKTTNISGREGVELYPTLEIGPTTPRTEAYLAHNAIPVQFTEEDFDQVLTGNFVTKVIYLPDPEFQELALAGVETLVSTRLDPGVDPITEADRRGAILAVIRLGNKDVELPGSNGDSAGVMPVSFQENSIGPGMQANYYPGMPGSVPMGAGLGGMPVPGGAMAAGPSGLIPSHVAGITAPEYGMPYGPTPLGLPGPPHIPFGGPAGLQKHTMTNHTRQHYPQPQATMKIHVRQPPGYSYPQPANRAWITEQTIHPTMPFNAPRYMSHEHIH